MDKNALCTKLERSRHLSDFALLDDGICCFTISDLGLRVEVFEHEESEQVKIYVKGVNEDNMSWENTHVSTDELLNAVCGDEIDEDLFFI